MSLSYQFDFETPKGLFGFYANENDGPLVSIRVRSYDSPEMIPPSSAFDLDCDEVPEDVFHIIEELFRCCIPENAIAVFDDIAKVLAGVPLRGNRYENGRRASDPPEVTYFRMLDEATPCDSDMSDIETAD